MDSTFIEAVRTGDGSAKFVLHILMPQKPQFLSIAANQSLETGDPIHLTYI